jgi:hypothetical protein
MLFIHRNVIDQIGGFDEGYGKWGMEHLDFSNRAFNSGASQVRYGDVINSLDYFVSLDHQLTTLSSTSGDHKRRHLARNAVRFDMLKDSKQYMPYKTGGPSITNAVIASYFTYRQDPQRKLIWSNDIEAVMPLMRSVQHFGVHCEILHDCFRDAPENFTLTTGDPALSPNDFRWTAQLEWIERNNPERVFMVDSTDVIMLHNPFGEIKPGKLYCGYEYGNNMMNQWMLTNQGRFLRLPDWQRVMQSNAKHPLLNCGVFPQWCPAVFTVRRRHLTSCLVSANSFR